MSEPDWDRQACRYGPLTFLRHDLYIGRSLALYGEWAEFEMRLLRPWLRPGDVVVDAGANVGTHTQVFAQAVGPSGRMVAFEPQRQVHALLSANMADNGLTWADCRMAALGAEFGAVIVPELPPEKALNFGGVSLGDFDEGQEVPVETVDGLNLESCRLLKIDVEGMESQVLQGAEATLRRFRPLLYVEADRLAEAAGIMRQLQEWEYRLWWHLAPFFNPENYRHEVANVFPDLVGVSLFGVPAEILFNPATHPGYRPGTRLESSPLTRLGRGEAGAADRLIDTLP